MATRSAPIRGSSWIRRPTPGTCSPPVTTRSSSSPTDRDPLRLACLNLLEAGQPVPFGNYRNASGLCAGRLAAGGEEQLGKLAGGGGVLRGLVVAPAPGE